MCRQQDSMWYNNWVGCVTSFVVRRERLVAASRCHMIGSQADQLPTQYYYHVTTFAIYTSVATSLLLKDWEQGGTECKEHLYTTDASLLVAWKMKHPVFWPRCNNEGAKRRTRGSFQQRSLTSSSNTFLYQNLKKDNSYCTWWRSCCASQNTLRKLFL